MLVSQNDFEYNWSIISSVNNRVKDVTISYAVKDQKDVYYGQKYSNVQREIKNNKMLIVSIKWFQLHRFPMCV